MFEDLCQLFCSNTVWLLTTLIFIAKGFFVQPLIRFYYLFIFLKNSSLFLWKKSQKKKKSSKIEHQNKYRLSVQLNPVSPFRPKSWQRHDFIMGIKHRNISCRLPLLIIKKKMYLSELLHCANCTDLYSLCRLIDTKFKMWSRVGYKCAYGSNYHHHHT